MSTITWLYVGLIIVPVAYFAWSVVSVDRRSQALIRSNLSQVMGVRAEDAPQQPRFFAELARHLTPNGYVAKLDRLLAKAGRPASMPLERLITLKPLGALTGGLVGLLLVSGNPSPAMIAISLFLFAAGYFLPDLLVHNTGTKRQNDIQLELPNVLDQMLISVEAGLGFESAMARTAASGKGPLADEFIRTLQDIQVGRSRRDAYRSLAERSTVSDLRSFVNAVVQADIYGIGLSRVLKTQAQQMRVKRRQRAEEKAMKLPVAVLFPLLLFIFPTLFIVILGPAVINIVDAFTNGSF